MHAFRPFVYARHRHSRPPQSPGSATWIPLSCRLEILCLLYQRHNLLPRNGRLSGCLVEWLPTCSVLPPIAFIRYFISVYFFYVTKYREIVAAREECVAAMRLLRIVSVASFSSLLLFNILSSLIFFFTHPNIARLSEGMCGRCCVAWRKVL